MSRFTKQERKQLVAVSKSIEWTAQLAERAESLRWFELTSDAYEIQAWCVYCEQVRAIHDHFKRLIDLRLERSSDADQVERGIEQGWELMHAMQAELGRIVEQHFERTYGKLFED